MNILNPSSCCDLDHESRSKGYVHDTSF